MGSIIFGAEILGDTLTENVGYKAGLALSIEEMCDHLSGTRHVDVLRDSEQHPVRLRAEDYEDLFYKLLHRIGHTAEEYNGDVSGAGLFHKYKDTHPDTHLGVTRLFVTMYEEMIQDAIAAGTKVLDPSKFFRAARQKYGRLGLEMAMERISAIDKGQRLNPHTGCRYTEWADIQELRGLYKGSKLAPVYGQFFDQRFIDYLSNNPDAIGSMHWRKFEEMTAEYFVREGFKVELGPGGNDDGVDVRFWKADSDGVAPHGIVQCKRQKDKIERVVVKGLMADVAFEKAQMGLIVTSSELSRGARENITVRGYPIREVNKDGLIAWLKKLRTPGTGIVRR